MIILIHLIFLLALSGVIGSTLYLKVHGLNRTTGHRVAFVWLISGLLSLTDAALWYFFVM